MNVVVTCHIEALVNDLLHTSLGCQFLALRVQPIVTSSVVTTGYVPHNPGI